MNGNENENLNVDMSVENAEQITAAVSEANCEPAGAAEATTNRDTPETQQEAPRDRIHIADDVIVTIVSMALKKVPDVTLAGTGVGDGIVGLFGMKNASKGIKVDSGDGGISVDISITVDYGKKIGEIVSAAQGAIRGDVTEMTGLSVAHVNVQVIGVSFKEPPAQKVKQTKPLAQEQNQNQNQEQEDSF